MKRIILIATILFAAVLAGDAQEKKVIKGFSGGMMVHTGYQFGCDYPYPSSISINSVTYGIGGLARLQFTEHFRAGFEGYFSTAPVKSGVRSGSHNKLFWTGALVDWFWKCGRFYPYVGVTLSGGMETACYILEGDKQSWEPTSTIYHKQPFFAVDPFVGMEYEVGKALRLTLKADWLTAINSDDINRPTGPRLYFGCIFAH